MRRKRYGKRGPIYPKYYPREAVIWRLFLLERQKYLRQLRSDIGMMELPDSAKRIALKFNISEQNSVIRKLQDVHPYIPKLRVKDAKKRGSSLYERIAARQTRDVYSEHD